MVTMDSFLLEGELGTGQRTRLSRGEATLLSSHAGRSFHVRPAAEPLKGHAAQPCRPRGQDTEGVSQPAGPPKHEHSPGGGSLIIALPPSWVPLHCRRV